MGKDEINKNSQDYLFGQLATSVEGINDSIKGFREDLKTLCADISTIKAEIAFIKGKLVVWTIIAGAVVGGVVSLIFKLLTH
jgi:hypothetical protein